MPHRVVGGLRFYERKEIKDVLAYLRMIHNPNDTVSLKRIVNVPPRGIGATTIAKLEEEAQNSGKGLYDVLKAAPKSDSFTLRAQNAIAAFVGMIEDLRAEAAEARLSDVVVTLLDKSGY